MDLAAWLTFWLRDANSVRPASRNSTHGPPCSNPQRLWLLPQVIWAHSFSIEIEKSEQLVMNLRPLLPQRLSSKERGGSRCLRRVERSLKPLPGQKRPASPRLGRAGEERARP